MSTLEVVVALVILVGLVGVIAPVLPGSLLVLAAIAVWASETTGSTAWTVLVVAALWVVVGAIVKYVVPGRRLKAAGVPNSTLWWGALAALVGFFVIPVLGLFVGFVVGVYAAERRRLGSEHAWPATRRALAAVGLSILIELVAALLAAGTWVVGVALT